MLDQKNYVEKIINRQQLGIKHLVGCLGNLRKTSENVRKSSSLLRNNFGKSSKSGRKSSENRQKRRH